MAWTAPTTWVDDQQVTKGQFNAWNANLASVGNHGGWTTWSPVLSTAYSYTWTTLVGSNGYVRARKAKLGKVGFASLDILWGTAAAGAKTFLVVTDQAQFVLPWTASTAAVGKPCGYGFAYHAVNDNTYTVVPVVFNTRAARMAVTTTDGPWWNGVVPGNYEWTNSSSVPGSHWSALLAYRTAT